MSNEADKKVKAIVEVVVEQGIERMEACGVPMELMNTGIYFVLVGLRIGTESPETGTTILRALYTGDPPDDSEAARSVKALATLVKATQEVKGGNGHAGGW